MVTRKSRSLLLATLLIGLALAPSLTAQGPSMHSTKLTFSQSFRLPGVELTAGTYTFEVAAPGSGVVRVMSRDRAVSYFQGFTNPVRRPAGLLRDDAAVTFGESAAGSAPPITAWWAEGESDAHSFIYR